MKSVNTAGLRAGTALTALALVATSAAIWIQDSRDEGSGSGHAQDASSSALHEGRRDPTLWPYGRKSIWNHPLGDDSERVDLYVAPPAEQTLAVEEDIIVISPSSLLMRPILEHDAGWSSRSRCDSLTGRVLAPYVPIPLGWQTDPGYAGSTPNHSAAILMPDGTLLETQPFHVCPNGTVVSQFATASASGSSIRSAAHGKNVPMGSHGGSGLTAFGGTIRLGEWVPERRIIPHVLKIELSAEDYLSGHQGGYRWPAHHADEDSQHYAETAPAASMGALLALPVDYHVPQLESPAAQILARTLKSYGAYAVDDTSRSTVAFSTEWGPQGRVLDEFQEQWGFDFSGDLNSTSGAQGVFLRDMTRIYASLQVVNDNRPGNVGGAGRRLAPWAPPLTPER